ncbi:MAG TPA: AAA family ATPase [Anaerohalosphaeraceae bacterium]|nr:AAA family ATPase [Anaerohalosphaeraceae bacterium]
MKHPKQTSRAELIAELEAAGSVVKGAAIRCPFHDDHNPSGGVYQGKDGVWRYRCHSCGAQGDVFDVRAKRTGRPLAEILRENTQDAPQSPKRPVPLPQAEKMTFASLEACYAYLGTQYGGKLEALHTYPDNFFVVRWRKADGKKEIRPLVRKDGAFVMTFPEDRRPLYHRDKLEQAETIIITEGELKADVLAGYGFAATTSAGGSKAAAKTDWTPLAGKNCTIWPDADTPGRQYANEVQTILEGLGARVKVIDPAALDLTDGEDAKDYIDQLKNAGYSDLEIKRNLSGVFTTKAKSTGPAAELQTHLADIGAGRLEPLETGFSTFDSILQILPGSLNLVCGSPGSSKSLLMLQLAARWHKDGVKTAIFELEKDRVFHLRRALAQEAGQAMLTNNRWTRENADLAKKSVVEHLDFLEAFGKAVYAMPEKIIYQRDVIEWTQQRADAGCRVVIIDPATKAIRTTEPWKADLEFVQALQQIAALTRIIVFFVLHPSKGTGAAPDLSAISGGAAYGRFADNAIWLELHEPKQSTIKTACGPTEIEHDRTVWVLKSRDGSGTGSRLAFEFCKENLTLRELGRIERKLKGRNYV